MQRSLNAAFGKTGVFTSSRCPLEATTDSRLTSHVCLSENSTVGLVARMVEEEDCIDDYLSFPQLCSPC
jgi:hypothetical protein